MTRATDRAKRRRELLSGPSPHKPYRGKKWAGLKKGSFLYQFKSIGGYPYGILWRVTRIDHPPEYGMRGFRSHVHLYEARGGTGMQIDIADLTKAFRLGRR